MFIRTLKVTKRQIKNQMTQETSMSHGVRRSLKKHTFQSLQNSSKIPSKSQLKLNLQASPFSISSQNKANKARIVSFQNQFIKAHAKKQLILDERKQCIKDRIKGKVKQQMEELIKRSELTYSSLSDIKIKDEVMRQSVLDVEVKGSSLKKSLRASYTHRPELAKLQKIRKTNSKKYSLKDSAIRQKILTVQSSPRQKTKGRRSLSNVIRLHQITSRKGVRNIHSALGGGQVPSKKNSVEIEPWQYTEDF